MSEFIRCPHCGGVGKVLIKPSPIRGNAHKHPLLVAASGIVKLAGASTAKCKETNCGKIFFVNPFK